MHLNFEPSFRQGPEAVTHLHVTACNLFPHPARAESRGSKGPLAARLEERERAVGALLQARWWQRVRVVARVEDELVEMHVWVRKRASGDLTPRTRRGECGQRHRRCY